MRKDPTLQEEKRLKKHKQRAPQKRQSLMYSANNETYDNYENARR